MDVLYKYRHCKVFPMITDCLQNRYKWWKVNCFFFVLSPVIYKYICFGTFISDLSEKVIWNCLLKILRETCLCFVFNQKGVFLNFQNGITDDK